MKIIVWIVKSLIGPVTTRKIMAFDASVTRDVPANNGEVQEYKSDRRFFQKTATTRTEDRIRKEK